MNNKTEKVFEMPMTKYAEKQDLKSPKECSFKQEYERHPLIESKILNTDAKILEIAAGAGHLSTHLKSLGYKNVVATDIHPVQQMSFDNHRDIRHANQFFALQDEYKTIVPVEHLEASDAVLKYNEANVLLAKGHGAHQFVLDALSKFRGNIFITSDYCNDIPGWSKLNVINTGKRQDSVYVRGNYQQYLKYEYQDNMPSKDNELKYFNQIFNNKDLKPVNFMIDFNVNISNKNQSIEEIIDMYILQAKYDFSKSILYLIKQNSKILEINAGTGLEANVLQEYGYDIIATDLYCPHQISIPAKVYSENNICFLNKVHEKNDVIETQKRFKYPIIVKQHEASDATLLYNSDVLLSRYPTIDFKTGYDWLRNALNHFKGNLFAYTGADEFEITNDWNKILTTQNADQTMMYIYGRSNYQQLLKV